MASRMRLFFGVLALAVMAGASCNNPNAPSGPPTPSVPTNPPNVPEEEKVFKGDIAASDPETCEPLPPSPSHPRDFRVCDIYTFTPGADGFAETVLDWTPAEPGAINNLVLSIDGGVTGSPTSPPSSTSRNGLVYPVEGGRTHRVGVYVVPGGTGRSNYTLRVKYPK